MLLLLVAVVFGPAVGCTSPAPPAVAAVDGAQATADATDTTGAAATDVKPDAAKDAVADVAKVDTGPAACSPHKNSGCEAQAGTHCAYDDDVAACIQDGSHGAGEDCSDNGGCKVGMCVKSQNGAQACAPFCIADVSCTSNSCNKIEGKKYKVCDVATYKPCDPLKQDCTDKTQGCYNQGGQFVCLSKGTADKDDTCEQSNDCKPGLACIGALSGTKGFCRKVCTVGGAACDPITVPCSQLSSKYGYCDG